MLKYLYPPKSISFELQQRMRYLHVALLVTAIGSVLFGVINVPMGAMTLVNLFFFIALFNIAGIALNHHGYYFLAALILTSLIFIAAVFNLYDGAGLSDPGIAAFPVFIILVGFFFRKWAVIWSTALSIATVYGMYLGHAAGLITLSATPTGSRAMILSILFIISGTLYWTISDNWERTLLALRESYDLTLQGWAKVLELRDVETEGHSERVEKLSVALALKMGLSKEDIRHFRRGAYLHDIGKIAVADQILFKTGMLNESDWQVMKRHPEMGRDMVAHIPFLDSTRDIIFSHHEKWDGSGYPQGLAGDAIPLWARIFALVDQWDALNSKRPYRDAWPREKIMAYFEENAGVNFDPAIVPVFLAMLNEEEIET
jgi:putative nucleotidyltransferase with HDIG domain